MNGIGATATSVSVTLTFSMIARATTKLTRLSATIGMNVRNSCTERMSLLAREISWPDCTLVVERERQRGEVLVDRGAQVVLEPRTPS